MTCDEVRGHITWYPGPTLAPRDRLAVVLHTLDCAGCRSDLVAALALAEAARAAAALPDPPPALRAAVLLAAAPQAVRSRRLRAALRRLLPPAAAWALDPAAALRPALGRPGSA